MDFEKGKIKHFHSIANTKDMPPSLREEAMGLVEGDSNTLQFKSFSKGYFIDQLRTLSDKNYKQVKSCLDLVLKENKNYIQNLNEALKVKLELNPKSDAELKQILKDIDRLVNTYCTELIDRGYAKNYLYRYFYAVLVNKPKGSFQECFQELERLLDCRDKEYKVCFRIQTSRKVAEAMTFFGTNVLVEENLHKINGLSGIIKSDKFNKPDPSTRFIIVTVNALDHFSALRKAKVHVAENLDLLHLGFADQFFQLKEKALVIDTNLPAEAEFQETKNFLDGLYKAAKEYYESFTEKVPGIINDQKISSETREKIKSAIRYLRLGCSLKSGPK